MRTCIRCKVEMIENFYLKVTGAGNGYGIALVDSKKIWKDTRRIGTPKVAVCPVCGEISIYLEDVEKLQEPTP